MPVSFCSRPISARICAWIVTSSAVVGSSAISRRRVAGHRERDHHALAHAARQLVRILVDPLRGGRDLDQFEHPLRMGVAQPCGRASGAAAPIRRSARRWSAPGSGWSSAPGRSFRARCRAARASRDSGRSSRLTRRPSRRTNQAWPSTCACEVLACRPISVRLVTDLPEPDSPTSASVSPGRIANETSATLWMRPASVAKEVDRPLHFEAGRCGWRSRSCGLPQLGSSRSRTPSPSICSDSAVSTMARPGQKMVQKARSA